MPLDPPTPYDATPEQEALAREVILYAERVANVLSTARLNGLPLEAVIVEARRIARERLPS